MLEQVITDAGKKYAGKIMWDGIITPGPGGNSGPEKGKLVEVRAPRRATVPTWKDRLSLTTTTTTAIPTTTTSEVTTTTKNAAMIVGSAWIIALVGICQALL